MAENQEAKKTQDVPKKKKRFSMKRFFTEYKSEFKKIVWPAPKTVLKNTGITIVMVGVIGIFVWILDYGLASLLGLILGK